MSERKIVGWKMKEEYKRYDGAALSICRVSRDTIDSNIRMSGWWFADDTPVSREVEKAGVLSLWFEPVYEEKFKVGDWVYVTKYEWDNNHSGLKEGAVFQATEIQDSTTNIGCQWVKPQGRGSVLSTTLRHATPAEIEAATKPKLPTINGYEGKIRDNYVVYGCQEVCKDDIVELHDAMIRVDARKITIKSTLVTIDEISQIVKAIK